MEILRLQNNAGGRKSTDSSSPEFDFWRQQNPSFNQPNILSADELFVDGVLLPLHLLHLHRSDEPPENPPPEQEKISPLSDSLQDPEIVLTASKRWTDIFKKKNQSDIGENKEKDKKKDKRKGTGAGAGGVPAELNINIWPFSRSRSAGNNGNKPKMGSGSSVTRKVSSAPCSRSNSRGESKSRKWPNSPTRSGVHLGRSSPVWQIRRVSVGKMGPDFRRSDNGDRKEEKDVRRKKVTTANSDGNGIKNRVLNINVPTCMSYRQHLSCRSVESSAVNLTVVGAGAGAGGGSDDSSGGGGSTDGGRSNMFNLRNLFIRKVY
ncbi:uncharacterized protein LOC124941977 [Impatiens glandulifera]|uniref:uncharacterized protein LOC124941977 n=1 Tax=Impatiens glandulifera TaxID=253017 RepID=UPI001FB1903A|nr:uncharacterized protein LOC124941977 [Impatiens glandulifera]